MENLRKALLSLGLTTPDFFDCLLVRRKALIEDFAQYFKGKHVLEIGPQAGVFTEALLGYASEVTVLENNPGLIDILKQRIGTQISIREGDVHHELFRMEPEKYDVIICSGILYHSSSPLMILEGLSYLRPKMLLLDTVFSPKNTDAEIKPYEGNRKNDFRFNNNPDSGMVIRLSERVIDQALGNLGFKFACDVKKDPDARTNSSYYTAWASGYSKWFSFSAYR